jgi:hypothetical protein
MTTSETSSARSFPMASSVKSAMMVNKEAKRKEVVAGHRQKLQVFVDHTFLPILEEELTNVLSGKSTRHNVQVYWEDDSFTSPALHVIDYITPAESHQMVKIIIEAALLGKGYSVTVNHELICVSWGG